MILVWLNVVIFLWIGIGLTLRKKPKYHIPIMLSAFVADMALLAVVEIRNHAVEKAVRPEAMTPVLFIHIAASLLFMALYFVLVRTGYRRLKNIGGLFHKQYAIVFLVARLINCLTSFLI